MKANIGGVSLHKVRLCVRESHVRQRDQLPAFSATRAPSRPSNRRFDDNVARRRAARAIHPPSATATSPIPRTLASGCLASPTLARRFCAVHPSDTRPETTIASHDGRIAPAACTHLTFLSNTHSSQANTTVVSQRSSLVVENRVTIRFTRNGRKKLPFYRIVAIDSRKRRDGAPLEYLGWYDPMKKEANLNAPAIRKWLAVGALPSETVSGLLKKAMVIEN